MRVGLSEQRIRFRFEGLHRVGPASETSRWFLDLGKLHNCVGELDRVAALLAMDCRIHWLKLHAVI